MKNLFTKIKVILLLFIFSQSFAQISTIKSGYSASGIISADGSVYAWGENMVGPLGGNVIGSLGTGNTSNQLIITPEQVIFPISGVQISKIVLGSDNHFLALTCDGVVWSWGLNDFGQCGSPAGGVITTPQKIQSSLILPQSDGFLPETIIDISAGIGTSYALLSSGRVLSWGKNEEGQLGNGSFISRAQPNYVLDKDNMPLENVTSIDAGDAFAMALVDQDKDGLGELYYWGSLFQSSNGLSKFATPQLKKDTSVLSEIKSFGLGAIAGYAIDKNDYVWSWGNGGWGGLTGIGQYLSHDYALQVLGGETGENYLKAKIVKGGQGFAMAVTLDNKLVTWGNNGGVINGGNLGDGTSTAYSVTPVYAKTALNTPITDVYSVSSSSIGGFVTKFDKSLWAWGSNSSGQLSVNNNLNRAGYLLPVVLPSQVIVQDLAPVVSLPLGFTTCIPFDFTIKTNFKNFGNNYQFQWYKDNNLLPNSSADTLLVNTATQPGTEYKLKLSYIGANAACGWKSDSGTIIIKEVSPDFTLPNNLTYCPTNTLSLSIDGNGEYDVYSAKEGGELVASTKKSDSVSLDVSKITEESETSLTVYVGEKSNVVGKAGLDVEPSTIFNTSSIDFYTGIMVYEDLYLDSVSIDAKDYVKTNDHNFQMVVYANQISPCGQNDGPNFSSVIFQGPIVTLSVNATATHLVLPLGGFLEGSKSGEKYWIGLENTPNAPLYSYQHAPETTYTDDVNGNILKVFKTNINECTASSNVYGYYYDLKFHTPPVFCDRIELNITKECPCFVEIPDAAFKTCLLSNTAINLNGNNEIECTEAESFSGNITCGQKGISDITGIEKFTALTELNLFRNSLTTVDLSANTALKSAGFHQNQLTSLNVSKNIELMYLDVTSNRLASLDLSKNINLDTLFASSAGLDSLDLTANVTLSLLVCSSNPISFLNVANGNNSNFSFFQAIDNENLSCIQVDNEAYSTANWTLINGDVFFSEDCSTVTAIGSQQNSQSLSVFPNPTADKIQIESADEILSLTIKTIDGVLVNSYLGNTTSVDLSSLNTGIYILETQTTSGLFLNKIVKK